MDLLPMNTLTERIERLEGAINRLKRASVIIVLLITVFLILGQAAPRQIPKVLEAEQFVLVDGNGKPRSRLAVRSDGAVAIIFLDKTDVVRSLFATLGDGSPSLDLYDASATHRARLSSTVEGTVGLSVNDQKGLTRLFLGVLKDDSPGIHLTDQAQRVRATFKLSPDGASSLRLNAKDRKEIWKAP